MCHFKYCFPKNCNATKYCDKFNNIPKYYKDKLPDLNGTHHCDYKQAYKNYLKSPIWSSIKSLMKLKHNFQCEECFSEELLEVHHKSYQSVFDEELKHLQLLCKDCHENKHKIIKK